MSWLPQFLSCVAFLLFTTTICDANLWTKTAVITKGKAVSTSLKTFLRFSEIQCVKKCYAERQDNLCNIAGYNKTSKVCALSIDSQNDLVDVADDMAGVFVMNDGQYSAC